MKGIMVGEMEPMIALRINWSCLVHRMKLGFGLVVLDWVKVAGGHGLEPSI